MPIKHRLPKCIGCGYCCTKMPCKLAIDILGEGIEKCEFLYWNGERHLCFLITNTFKVANKRIRVELAIGAGCTSSMFNTFRQELKDRTDIKYQKF